MACLGAPVALQPPLCASRGANSHAVHMRGEVTSDQQPCEKTLGCPEFSSSEPAHTIVVNVREDGEALCTGRGIYAAHACSKSLDRDTLLTQRTLLRPRSGGCPLAASALPVGRSASTPGCLGQPKLRINTRLIRSSMHCLQHAFAAQMQLPVRSTSPSSQTFRTAKS